MMRRSWVDVADSASGDSVRRRGLPTARGGEGDTAIFTYNVVLSVPRVPSPPLPVRVLFLRYRCLDLAAWGFFDLSS
jgi:hypothetical protein